MPRLTEKSIVRPSELFRELEAIRRQGYAVDDEEARLGLRCVAAVVYNDCSEPLAAISVSGMTSRLTDDGLPALGRTVHEIAAELTVALGGDLPGASDERSLQRESGGGDSTFSSR
jgi:IclR family acetate operon transcriptional repressor